MSVLRRRGRITLAYTLIGLGTFGLMIGGILYIQQHSSDAPTKVRSVATDSSPSSTKPDATTIARYKVSPTLPKYIAIPAINLDNTRVLALGIKRSGQIASPGNIYDTGWYDGSKQPGQSGAMFIYGHASNWTAKGSFYNLKKLKQGDKILITRGDNQKYIYQVIKTKVYAQDKVDMNAVLSPVNATSPGLNLMTCTGKIIKGTNNFSERLVVFTTLDKS